MNPDSPSPTSLRPTTDPKASRRPIPGRVRPVTIHDVARTADVSISTVSRVVRKHGDVRNETRERVQAVIDRLGYRPSSLARALVSGYSRTIALVVSDISNPFYPQLAKSVEREARLQGFAMVICNTEDEPDETVRYVRELIDHGVAGIVHGSVGLDEQRVLDVLGDARRIVFTNRRPVSGAVSYAVSDNRLGARLLGEHLTDLGHRRIGFIAGPVWAANSRERLVGLAEAAAAAGAELLSLHGDFTPDSVAGMLDTWLADGPYPTAVVGVSDHVALAALAGLNERGFRIPNDVAVAGFDDINLVVSRLLGLTTVAQRIDELGRRAVQILLRQLRSKTFRVQRVELAPDLVIRQTTRREVQPAAPRSVSVDHLSERALRTIAD